jgi:nitroreductase
MFEIMKHTPVEYPILDAIKNRWSPRAFSDQAVSTEQLNCLFEAARWASSSMNEQPWRFIYAHKGEEVFDTIANSLFEGNVWAKQAPVLMVTLAKTTFTRNERPNGAALHDLGLAVANLSIQATAEGLSLHQMGGVDKELLRAAFDIPDFYQIVTVIALGHRGTPDQLDEALRARELAERKRHPVSAFAFHGTFKLNENEHSIA